MNVENATSKKLHTQLSMWIPPLDYRTTADLILWKAFSFESNAVGISYGYKELMKMMGGTCEDIKFILDFITQEVEK